MQKIFIGTSIEIRLVWFYFYKKIVLNKKFPYCQMKTENIIL